MTDQSEPKKKLKRNRPSVDMKSGLSSGLTLLNLAITGSPKVAFFPGTYNLLVGQSGAGKSWLSMQALAEAAINPEYEDYRLVYDNAENGTMMDIRRYFGRLADRLEPIAGNKDNPESSATVEEYQYNMDELLKSGKPSVSILDSMDALSSDSEQSKFTERKKAHENETKSKGSYGDGKAKLNSSGMRVIRNQLTKTGSIHFVISQVRDNIGFGAMFNPEVRSGGHALKFYATTEIWFSIKSQIKKNLGREFGGKEFKIGTTLRLKVKKNRQTGWEPTFDIPFYPSIGFDNSGSIVDFLLEVNHWKETKGRFSAPEFDFNGTSEQLVHKIEKEDREKELITLISNKWAEIEQALSVQRKSRY